MHPQLLHERGSPVAPVRVCMFGKYRLRLGDTDFRHEQLDVRRATLSDRFDDVVDPITCSQSVPRKRLRGVIACENVGIEQDVEVVCASFLTWSLLSLLQLPLPLFPGLLSPIIPRGDWRLTGPKAPLGCTSLPFEVGEAL